MLTSEVSYLDSASYGCLMDIYQMMCKQNGTVKLVGLQEPIHRLTLDVEPVSKD